MPENQPVPINLNLLDYSSGLKTRLCENRRELLDPVRKAWVAMTPEELVRQTLLSHLVSVMSYPLGRIAVEKGIVWNGLQFRFDLLVYGPDMQPFLLVECKAPHVQLKESVLWQITRYNLRVKAPFSLITNGVWSCCASLDHLAGTAEWIDALPPYPKPQFSSGLREIP